MPNDDDLRLLDLLDWWEGHRWAASQLCLDESAQLKATVFEAVENLSVTELIFSSSDERAKIEEYIAQEIMRVETSLTASLAQEISNLSKETATQAPITDYSGWSYWDLGRLALGGGAPTAIAIAGGRAATGVLAAAGLATIAAPVTIVAALGGLAWSAYSTGEQMRTSYRDALMEGIDRCLLADPEASVWARHCAVLDQIFKSRTGAA
ncbi:MAG: hypothetical protein A3D16_23595 [Rhodobacterales bacterium RIFCSPHIGHO2_02_FULL_62_130]|nr:MAG: hypothetical protein A3D16_23595 [Rhodobacterales bacterium RIFCSPHIGHO2_02_FULL_62_130]OHC59499.1 MAG: hypothetical protein A3E48_18205 [Rhodobacterales bacterium RIFCSPHIGHO2_12_FULL_62_75]HCY99436.1 hypothetical protein [Rhodobacter sp.]